MVSVICGFKSLHHKHHLVQIRQVSVWTEQKIRPRGKDRLLWDWLPRRLDLYPSEKDILIDS